VRSSDAALRVLALVVAVALLVVVRGERTVTVSVNVPLAPRLPPALGVAGSLPADVSVSLAGPWSRLRAIDPADLGPALADLTRAGPATAAWSVRPETLHVPRGVRVASIYPATGTVELRAPATEPPPPARSAEERRDR
jgi:hypothetical protein